MAFNPARSRLAVCGHELFRGGTPTGFNAAAVSRAMKRGAVDVSVHVGGGSGRARYYSCDLTHGYITINAEYHT